jgi:UDP-N-acetylmuramate dehydrogenase
MELKEDFETDLNVPVIFDAPMKEYTTYRTGGAAKILVLPATEDQLKRVVVFAKAKNTPLRVLGMGSNILVSDGGLTGITCCLKNLKGLKIEGSLITALAGTALDDVCAAAVNRGLEGLEGLSGIPGSAGGAVYMNAGAFNQETFDKLVSLTVLDAKGNFKTLKKGDIKHSYRRVEGIEECIILNAVWRLNLAQNPQALKDRRAEILTKRMEKQPLDYPSAGSVFKRPQGSYASYLIDNCGLKGLKIGGAIVSAKHAGFIINYDNATAADIKNLMDEVKRRVFESTGVNLELEQILWGNFN